MPRALPARSQLKAAPPRRVAGRVLRAARAPWARKRLWARALPLVVLVRLGLWALPLKTLQVLVARIGRGRYSEPVPAPGAPRIEPDFGRDLSREYEASWAVTHASRLVPRASCLTQALALQGLLGQRGLASRLCIGVRKGHAKGFEAHAWVESGGRVLIGGQQAAREDGEWTPLTSWDFTPRREEVSTEGSASP